MPEMYRSVPVENEPKMKNNFELLFPTELGIESFLVQTVQKPSLNINSIEIPYMNSSTFVSGRSVWQPMEVTFIDTVGPSTTQKVMEWVRLHFESTTGRKGYAVGYKKNLILNGLDPTGVAIEKWTLIGCQITVAGFDSYDYGDDALTMISITIQPDRCILES
jgi:hypothetical protein